MPHFTFRLDPLLKYRRYRRDVLRSAYARALAERDAMRKKIDGLQRRRDTQFDEIRERTACGAVDVDGTATRRFHAGRISLDELVLQHELEDLGRRVETCRGLVMQAERDVEALQKLRDRRRAEFEYRENRRRQHELEDVWNSAHAGDFAP